MKIAALAATALLASATLADAAPRDRGYGSNGIYRSVSGYQIDIRQANQAARIEQGRRSGELTRHEYLELKAEQERIARMERRAKADGYLSARERARIDAAQKSASRHIYAEKHDRQTRYAHGKWNKWNKWYRWGLGRGR